MVWLDPAGKLRPRRPTFKGSIQIDALRGTVRVRKWPAKRGPPKDQEEHDRREKFRRVMWLTKYLPAIIQEQMRSAVAGTPLLPRDLLVQQLYGRFAAYVMTDGRKVYPMTARQDISDSLDILSQIVGSILFRGPDWWEALPPGDAGQVLVMNATMDGLEWADPATIQGIQSATVNTQQSRNNAAYGDLTTAGPSVTLVTGTEALVTLDAIIQKTSGGAGFNGYMSVAVSGATTIAASDTNCMTNSSPGGGFADSASRTFKITGLTPGSNTFTAKYRTNGASFDFWNRDITVTALA